MGVPVNAYLVLAFNSFIAFAFCVLLFLISLKAGGTGLNLTGADVVIHFDPWWNPAIENQATDRAHRYGQENIVEVIKLTVCFVLEQK